MPVNTFQFNQRYEKNIRAGMSDAEVRREAEEFATIKPAKPEAARKSLAGENAGTKELIERLRKGGMSDADIEASGIYKFGEKRRRNILAEVLTRRGRRELWGGGELYLHETPEERKRRVREQKFEEEGM